MATIELTQPALVGKIEQLASALQRPVQQVLEAAVQDYLDRLEGEAIQQESDAYRRMYPHLARAYPDEYVTIQGGQVVDHDPDVSALEQRVNERFKWHPVLIAPLTLPPVELHWRGARLSEKEGV
jgi:hypothetical protein